MKKILSSLPVRLIIGVVIGIIIGLGSADLWIGGTDVGGTIMQVVLTLKNLLGSLINFCVPLIIIGFIAPSITRLRSNASRMLVLALALAYTSSVCAALMSMGAGYAIIPGLSIQSAAEGLREAPELLFNLDIAPVCAGGPGGHLDQGQGHHPGAGGVPAGGAGGGLSGGDPHPALLYRGHLLRAGL